QPGDRQGAARYPVGARDPPNAADIRTRPGAVGGGEVTIDWANTFSHPWWVYVSIPLGAALVGWATKILALKMMFYPVEFKGIKPYLGWQGQIPQRAP